MSMLGCQSYCSHGAQCVKETHLSGKHRSALSDTDPTACEWTSAEGITRKQADMILIRFGGAEGIRIVAEQRITEMLFTILHEYRDRKGR